MKVEDVFCSKPRLKILKLLYRYGQLNPSAIMRKLRINYRLTMRNLELLESEGVVHHRLSGRTRFYRLTHSLKAEATVNMLESWEP
ncbi:winged helix-turn-helix transcriptional regulator [Candidatus Bathyarchaeota archaeon]|nr:winged helix-turn-helix transcriptional regulator [Candidatus Bathyarchaeota archaeon]